MTFLYNTFLLYYVYILFLSAISFNMKKLCRFSLLKFNYTLCFYTLHKYKSGIYTLFSYTWKAYRVLGVITSVRNLIWIHRLIQIFRIIRIITVIPAIAISSSNKWNYYRTIRYRTVNGFLSQVISFREWL